MYQKDYIVGITGEIDRCLRVASQPWHLKTKLNDRFGIALIWVLYLSFASHVKLDSIILKCSSILSFESCFVVLFSCLLSWTFKQKFLCVDSRNLRDSFLTWVKFSCVLLQNYKSFLVKINDNVSFIKKTRNECRFSMCFTL